MNINLLPWREAMRKRWWRSNLYWATALALLSLLIACDCRQRLVFSIQQLQANQRVVKQRLNSLQVTTQELLDLNQQYNDMAQRVARFEQLLLLQHSLLQLLRDLPEWFGDGIYLTHLRTQAEHIYCAGYAESSQPISHLLHALNAHPCIRAVGLPHVKMNALRQQAFNLKITLGFGKDHHDGQLSHDNA